jgi:hypothetical protein
MKLNTNERVLFEQRGLYTNICRPFKKGGSAGWCANAGKVTLTNLRVVGETYFPLVVIKLKLAEILLKNIVYVKREKMPTTFSCYHVVRFGYKQDREEKEAYFTFTKQKDADLLVDKLKSLKITVGGSFN